MWFEFRLVGYGWAEAGIGDDDAHATLTASYISDALGDLLYAVWRVLEGDADARCSWEEEPGEFRWIMRRQENNISLRILEFPDQHPRRPDDAGRLAFETTQEATRFARAIALGASRALAEYGERGYQERWNTFSFPESTLRKVQEALHEVAAKERETGYSHRSTTLGQHDP